jgi:hypothetical protein
VDCFELPVDKEYIGIRMALSKHLLSEFVLRLRTKLAALKAAYPDTYPFPTELLNNINFHTVDINNSYIQVDNIGMEKFRFCTIMFGTAIRVSLKNTDCVLFQTFEYLCKGIYDTVIQSQGIRLVPNPTDSSTNYFRITRINPILEILPEEMPDRSYWCELLFNIYADLSTIPGEEVELSEDD